MGTIIPRKRKDGSASFLAQIMRRAGGKMHRESKTFERRVEAQKWIDRREAELDAPGGLDRAAAGDPKLADVIDRYTAETHRQIGRTKAQVLRAIKEHDIAGMRCSEIGSEDIVAFAQKLRAAREPQTVQNYLSHLGAVFAVARPAWRMPLDPQAMKDALVVAKRLGLTSKSRERSRRVTLDEMAKLVEHFEARQNRRPGVAPMARIIAFALFSTRRMEEITRIAWEDLEPEPGRVLVRDMKNPGDKLGNNVWCDLPPEAVKLANAQPAGTGPIFPYSTDAIGAAFTRACHVLEIKDLHFHDLRHEGVSRLFEMGWSIPHVAAVSGHRSWSSLKRYTHIRQTGDKWAGAPWLAKLL